MKNNLFTKKIRVFKAIMLGAVVALFSTGALHAEDRLTADQISKIGKYCNDIKNYTYTIKAMAQDYVYFANSSTSLGTKNFLGRNADAVGIIITDLQSALPGLTPSQVTGYVSDAIPYVKALDQEIVSIPDHYSALIVTGSVTSQSAFDINIKKIGKALVETGGTVTMPQKPFEFNVFQVDVGTLPALPEYLCGDNVDNDSNGLKDCQDPACIGTRACPTR